MYGIQDQKQHDVIHPFSSILPILRDVNNNDILESKTQNTKNKEKRVLNEKDVVVDLEYLRRLNRNIVNHM